MSNVVRAAAVSAIVWALGLGLAIAVDSWPGAAGDLPLLTLVWGLCVAHAPGYAEGGWFGPKWRRRLASASLVLSVLGCVGLVIWTDIKYPAD